MDCLTDEQLAGHALGLAGNGPTSEHVEKCVACRMKSAALIQLAQRLAAAHGKFDLYHLASRSQLLASLDDTKAPCRSSYAWHGLVARINGLTIRQRIAAAGLGLSTVAGMALLIAIFVNLATPLSAMERMAKQLREVKSYSYRLFARDTFMKEGQTDSTTVIHTGTTYWLEPDSLYYDEKIERTEGSEFPDEQESGLLAHFTGIHPTGKPGLMVYHAGREESKAKTYYPIPEVRADEVGDKSPITRLRAVREGAGQILRTLGTKEIDGKRARGYVMALANAELGSGFDALEVWVDPQTDLPVEIGYKVTSNDNIREFRISECRWNIEIEPSLFDTTPPEGYSETAPPQ
jgi:outer membrane lipoprotein-sorting protein